jgi:hypothetical protein
MWVGEVGTRLAETSFTNEKLCFCNLNNFGTNYVMMTAWHAARISGLESPAISITAPPVLS